LTLCGLDLKSRWERTAKKLCYRHDVLKHPKVGVLALQGDFREHRQALERLGCDVQEVRLPKHLIGLEGVIFPGGESTTIGKLMHIYELDVALKEFHANGGAIWGTCAGAIMLASGVLDSSGQDTGQPRLSLLEMTVVRNAFGRQVDSFETDLEITGLEKPFHAVFIRAPIIQSVGVNVDVLCKIDERIVVARKDRLMASSFHPELTGDDRLHQYFLEQVIG
jgi:pyridoxal 5'-phosphate synthase pdxT subunit